MIYSASSELARVQYDDSSFFLKRQFARAVLGLFVMVVVSRIPLEWFARYSRAIMLWAIFLLVLVLFFGSGPADRWLYLPRFLLLCISTLGICQTGFGNLFGRCPRA